MSNNVLGFEISNGEGGDFTPHIRYHTPSGRILRYDRVQSDNGFVSEPVDITPIFKAVCDFDNAQSGWIEFTPNGVPVMALTPLSDIKSGKSAYPDKPTPGAKRGFRFLMKLHHSCGGEKPIREIAGNSNGFLNGIAAVYGEYESTKGQYPGKLPILTMNGTVIVKSGSATNFQPVFKISGWAPRPEDLKPEAPKPVQTVQAAPVTGAHTVPPPNVLRSAQLADDDFG